MMKTLPILLIFLSLAGACCASPVYIQIHGIDMGAIKEIESSGNPLAVSRCGAIGLYQITKPVLTEYNEHFKTNYTRASLFVPSINEKISYWYFHFRIPQLLRHYNKEESLRNVLICYNFGIGNFLKYCAGEKELPIETLNYIQKYKALTMR